MNERDREEMLTMLDAICADDEKREALINQLLSLRRCNESSAMPVPECCQGECL